MHSTGNTCSSCVSLCGMAGLPSMFLMGHGGRLDTHNRGVGSLSRTVGGLLWGTGCRLGLFGRIA